MALFWQKYRRTNFKYFSANRRESATFNKTFTEQSLRRSLCPPRMIKKVPHDAPRVQGVEYTNHFLACRMRRQEGCPDRNMFTAWNYTGHL